MFSAALPMLILLGASLQEATVLGRRFKKIDTTFDDKLTALHEVSAVSLLKCNVVCSVLPGCLALEFKRTISHCTMYGHLGVTDGGPVSVGRVSDDARRYAISDKPCGSGKVQRGRPSTPDRLKAEEKRYTTFPIEGSEIHLKRYDVKRTWDGALEMCRSDGATLVKIDNAEKQDIVRGLFNFKDYENSTEPWTGLRDTNRSNVYRWTDGSVPTYTKWWKGEPSFTSGGQDQDCVVISLGIFVSAWDDRHCNILCWFVCEM